MSENARFQPRRRQPPEICGARAASSAGSCVRRIQSDRRKNTARVGGRERLITLRTPSNLTQRPFVASESPRRLGPWWLSVLPRLAPHITAHNAGRLQSCRSLANFLNSMTNKAPLGSVYGFFDVKQRYMLAFRQRKRRDQHYALFIANLGIRFVLRNYRLRHRTQR